LQIKTLLENFLLEKDEMVLNFSIEERNYGGDTVYEFIDTSQNNRYQSNFRCQKIPNFRIVVLTPEPVSRGYDLSEEVELKLKTAIRSDKISSALSE
jgi:hypothetical protein